jgi:hypothetical protein
VRLVATRALALQHFPEEPRSAFRSWQPFVELLPESCRCSTGWFPSTSSCPALGAPARLCHRNSQELLLRNDYLAAENQILRGQLKGSVAAFGRRKGDTGRDRSPARSNGAGGREISETLSLTELSCVRMREWKATLRSLTCGTPVGTLPATDPRPGNKC